MVKMLNERWGTWTMASLSASSALVASSLIQGIRRQRPPRYHQHCDSDIAKQAANACGLDHHSSTATVSRSSQQKDARLAYDGAGDSHPRLLPA